MESSAWPKNLSSSSKRAIQELCGQNPKKLRDAFDAHSQTGDDPWQPLFAEDLISVLGSFSNTQSLSSGAESYEVSQVPGNACVMSGVSEGSKSVETPFRRFQMSPVESVETPSQGSSSPTKPKTHECSICGLEFAIGQALGGHMRRHRAAMSEGARTATATAKAMAMAMAPPPCPLAQISAVSRALQAPVVKKTNSGRVLWLDLNLTPMENESDLEFRFMTKTPAPPPVIDCYVV